MNTELITERLQEFANTFDIPGLAVRAVNQSEVLFDGHIGYRDVEAKLPVTQDTYFGLASVSKSFIGLLLVCLEADGVLSLNDEVTKFLPDFSYPGLADRPPVLIKHLVNHSSGIPPLRGLDYALEPWQRNDPAAAYNTRDYSSAPEINTSAELLAYLRAGEGPLIGDPGEFVSYSNDTYGVAGAVIEAATGRSLHQVLRERVLTPLGMRRTTFDTDAVMEDGNSAVLYTPTPNGRLRSPTWDQAPAYDAAGFLKSTIADLGTYLRFYFTSGSALGITRTEIMKTKTALTWSAPGMAYALGWNIEHLPGMPKMVTHGGSLKGVSSRIGFLPQHNFGVAVLTNIDGVRTRPIWQAVVNLFLSREMSTPLYSLVNRTVRPSGDLVGEFTNNEPWCHLWFVKDDPNILMLSGEDREPLGNVFLLDTDEFLVRGKDGIWDGGRVHRASDGSIYALQFGMRWYHRVE